MKPLRKFQIALAIAAIIVGGYYFLRIHRYSKSLTVGKWHMDYAVPWMACQTCGSLISRIEYDGQPIPMPNFPLDEDLHWNQSRLVTPMGSFRICNDLNQWRFYFDDVERLKESDTPITKEDLGRGYYLQRLRRKGDYVQAAPKKNTPPHWCYLEGFIRCWIDPLRFDKIDWDGIASQATN
ncbi:MAG TPA: hypothetical protein PKN33_08995 [Phycisphaerae bacterium]|nr:hypothetical protein [Phycisphaerae bacterium]